MSVLCKFFLIVFLSAICDHLLAVNEIEVQDFEGGDLQLSSWVVNIPNDNAGVQISSEQKYDGAKSLKLHYKFVGSGNYQYIGIPIKTRILGTVETLSYRIKGDGSKVSYGLQLEDSAGETHQYRSLSSGTGQGGIVDFAGWKEAVFDLNAGRETWGGDNNGKIDYPIKTITLMVGQPKNGDKLSGIESDIYYDSIRVSSEKSAVEVMGCVVTVAAPEYGSGVYGDIDIKISAAGFKDVVVKSLKVEAARLRSTVTIVELDEQGNGSFAFKADEYPHGPVTLTISGKNDDYKDNCYLQLYNTGGVSWRESLPDGPPPGAEGMKLVFADDFDGPLSISGTDMSATYYDHKPPNGWQDFSTIPFTSYHKENNPFKQVDTYLRIRASEKAKSSGLISSMKNDASGITAKAPCYFECRFVGPNATGSWPAFWLMTDYMTAHLQGKEVPCDELDIIEAYGGEGPGSPNAYDTYMVVPHAWNQGENGKAIEKAAFEKLKTPIRMYKLGIETTWYEMPHTYGCKITERDTIYYCDDIEVGRHETMPLSKTEPFFFLINLATGGGWPVDLSRYNGQVDMYVDYVRVYQGR